MAFENWRLNPFTGIMNDVAIIDEPHTIQYNSDWNAYGIQLNESPALDNPSTVIIVEDITGGTTFSEVPRTQAPGSGQYRVDYDASTYYGTGRIEFNPADNGKDVLVSYQGTGGVVKNDYTFGTTHLLGDLDVDGDTNIDGDAVIDGTLNVAGGITGDVAGNLTGDVTGNLTGDVSGNVSGNVTGDLTGGIKETGVAGGILNFKIIPIGDWNMDSTAYVDIAHGLDSSKIRTMYVIIKIDQDISNWVFPLTFTPGGATSAAGSYAWDETKIELSRTNGGAFDTAAYDATSYNRGFITIGYID
jgi:hypothetical protein